MSAFARSVIVEGGSTLAVRVLEGGNIGIGKGGGLL